MSEKKVVAVYKVDREGKKVHVFGEGVRRREVPKPLTHQLRKYAERGDALPVIVTEDGVKIFKLECNWTGGKAAFEKHFRGYDEVPVSIDEYRKRLNVEEQEYVRSRSEFVKRRIEQKKAAKDREEHFKKNRENRFKAAAEMRKRAAEEKAARADQAAKEKKDGESKPNDGRSEPNATPGSGS